MRERISVALLGFVLLVSIYASIPDTSYGAGYAMQQENSTVNEAYTSLVSIPQFEFIENGPEILKSVNDSNARNVVRSYNATASWYKHGRVTANGESFIPANLTVAHKRLPFNTLIRFTNPENGQSVIARVNDRGPYIRGREFDLSHGCAIILGIAEKGVARLIVEVLEN